VLVFATAALLVVALASAMKSGLIWSPIRIAGLAGLLVLAGTTSLYRTYPSSYDDKPSAVDFRLPLDGPVTIAWGGPTRGVNYHVGSPAERWAYDLLVTTEGLTHRADGRELSDYYAYGRPVRSPADGLVVHTHDGDPEAAPGRSERLLGAGNHVVLEVASGQYLFIAHLGTGSVQVSPGQRVRQGDVVGRVGNSGNSSEPHVHLHLQDAARPDAGEGIPFYLSDSFLIRADGSVRRAMPRGGVRRGRYVGDIVISSRGRR
jgi:hypothetical protein